MKFTLSLVLAFLCVPAVHAQYVGTAPAAQVDDLMAAYGPESPGGVVAVVRGGDVVFAEGYGSAHLEHGVPSTPETVFYIGSVGKQFTAFAVAMLADRGLLDLDDEVRTHIPELANFGAPITIRNLLHHTSGLRDSFGLLALSGVREGDLVTQHIARSMVLKQQALNFEPGTEYSYSNANYILLAEIVERVTGQSFRSWMHENVFAPLGMNDTLIGDNHQEVIPGRAASYAEGRTEGMYETEVFPFSAYGAGGVYTSANDMRHWLRNFRTAEVGGRGVAEQMLERGVLADGDTLSYALGLILREHRGLRVVFHDGGLAGYRSSLLYYPEIDAGVVVLGNVASLDAGGMARGVAEAFFGDAMEAEPVAEAASSGSNTAPDAASVPSDLLDAYVGRFQISGGPAFETHRSGDGLEAQLPGQPSFPITALADTLFRVQVPGENIRLLFRAEPSGHVNSGIVYDGDQPIPFERLAWAPDAEVLAAYVGRYTSPELETTYEVQVADDRLVLVHARHGEIGLTPNEEDAFVGDAWFVRSVAFDRDNSGRVTRMRVSKGRVRDVDFDRAPVD